MTQLSTAILIFCWYVLAAYCCDIPKPSSCSTNEVTVALNDFGFRLFQEIDTSENFVISPLSISTSIAIAHLGAGGNTATQIETAFHWQQHKLNSTKFHASLSHLLSECGVRNNDTLPFLMANFVFMQHDLIKNSYFKNLRQLYLTTVKMVDFQSSSHNTMKNMNNWVKSKTKGKIEEIVTEPFSSTTRLVLTNAAYFKGVWMVPFSEISEGLFHRIDGYVKCVQMMHIYGKVFKYFENSVNHYKFLEIPYQKEQHTVMLLAMYHHWLDLNIYRDLKLTSTILCRIRRSMLKTKMAEVAIPKFRTEFVLEMKESLKRLGIKDLFSASDANLDNIGSDKLFVFSALHKAVIDVNEERNATSEFFSNENLSLESEETTFVADRPFRFYIIDDVNGLVLFSGKITDP